MASARTWFGTNTVLSTLSQEMSPASPGADATSSPQMGWVVSTGATLAADMDAGTNVAATAFVNTNPPDGSLVTGTGSNGDHFRTTSKYTGDFANANWVWHGVVIGVTNSGAQDGRIDVRLFRGANADGTGAVEVTAGKQTGATLTNLSTVQQDSSATFNPGAFSVNDEYIFIQVAWVRTGAGGMTTTDVAFRYGTTGTRLISSAFTDTAVGSAAATGTATGVGASTARADGAAACTGTATGVGTAIIGAAGSASATSTATGAGGQVVAGAGSAAATGTATGVGASVSAAAGSAGATGSATAEGASTAAGVGAASALVTAAGDGVSAAGGVGAAACASTADATGAATFAGVGSASATSTAIGEIEDVGAGGGGSPEADGFASCTVSASGVGAATHAAVGDASAAADATANGAAVAAAEGQASATATALGVADGLDIPGTVTVTSRVGPAVDVFYRSGSVVVSYHLVATVEVSHSRATVSVTSVAE